MNNLYLSLAELLLTLIGIFIAISVYFLKHIDEAIGNYRGRVADIIATLENKYGFEYYEKNCYELLESSKGLLEDIHCDNGNVVCTKLVNLKTLVFYYENRHRDDNGKQLTCEKIILWARLMNYYLEKNLDVKKFFIISILCSFLISLCGIILCVLLNSPDGFSLSITMMGAIILVFLALKHGPIK